jgi:uncharacterized RDD family membrane protein YckC
VNYAGFWPRFGALLIDGLVAAPVIVLIVLAFHGSIGWAIASLVLLNPLGTIYPVYFHGRFGQTLGKMATGIKVVSVDGEPIGFGQAFRRHSVEVFLSVVYVSTTVYTLATWNGPDWNTLAYAARYPAISDANIVSASYSWVSNIWAAGEVLTLLFNKRRRALHDFIGGTVVIRPEKPRLYPDVPPPMARVPQIRRVAEAKLGRPLTDREIAFYESRDDAQLEIILDKVTHAVPEEVERLLNSEEQP